MKTQVKQKAILVAVVVVFALGFASCRKQQGCPTFSIDTVSINIQ